MSTSMPTTREWEKQKQRIGVPPHPTSKPWCRCKGTFPQNTFGKSTVSTEFKSSGFLVRVPGFQSLQCEPGLLVSEVGRSVSRADGLFLTELLHH